ncbi:MAG: thiamine biosynthesis/tRNA modification protein ThiI [Bacillales bacterium]|jgi:thiamine biosynthesis protein ThiI|nr:thiamine biosynthesis/tRNA modification protein ThiI [Bacillales bacterium]
MEFNHILVRYGELSTKGRNRSKFVSALRENVQFRLKQFEKVKVKAERDRLYVELNGEPFELVMDELEKVFGIHTFNLALKTETDLEKIKEAVLYAADISNSAKTFKITVHRAFKRFPMDTYELQSELGAHVLINLQGKYTVDVRNPELNIRVEIREDASYVMLNERKGAGGYPVGVGGKAMLLLSGGIDSPVAAYLTMKRGVNVEFIHFHSPPFTSERSKQKVEDLAKVLSNYCRKVQLHIVPFTELQKAIHKDIPGSYTMTIMRRMMLRIAEEVAIKRKALALATGESLGQVASQTLDSMSTINEVTNMPVLRPLITMDKLEIMEIANKINTYNISIRPYEDCCTIFLPENPTTKPKKDKANVFESKFDFEPYIEDAVNNIETLSFVRGMSQEDQELEKLF